MTVTEAPKPPKKPPHRDHPPLVAGTRKQAILFAGLVIFATLSPLILGYGNLKFIPRLPSLDWTLAIDARSSAAAAKIHQQKIVFIGGSNIRFGVDAAVLSHDLGTPVVNYGLHASLGLDVITDRALKCVNPGDIVVFSPELSHFRKNGAAEYSDDLRIDFLADHPSTLDPQLQSFPTREWRRSRSRCNRIRGTIEKFLATGFARVVGTEHAGASGKPDPTPYTVDAVGDDGAIIFPRPGPKTYERWTLSDPPANVAAMDLVDSRGGVAFTLAKNFCAKNHCLFCVMPPIRLSVPQFDQDEMLRMEQTFIDYAVKNGAVEIMKPGDNVLPREDGYDTDYHLNDIGVKLMEPRLVTAVKTVLR